MSKSIKVKSVNLDFYYGSFKALEDITLDFEENKVTALIGPSGCGKSTFLRCLNRMNDLIPNTRGPGRVAARRRERVRPEAGRGHPQAQGGDGLPEAQSLSQDEFRERGLRASGQRV